MVAKYPVKHIVLCVLVSLSVPVSADRLELRNQWVTLCEAQTKETWRDNFLACINAGNLTRENLDTDKADDTVFLQYLRLEKAVTYYDKGCGFGQQQTCEKWSTYKKVTRNKKIEAEQSLDFLKKTMSENTLIANCAAIPGLCDYLAVR